VLPACGTGACTAEGFLAEGFFATGAGAEACFFAKGAGGGNEAAAGAVVDTAAAGGGAAGAAVDTAAAGGEGETLGAIAFLLRSGGENVCVSESMRGLGRQRMSRLQPASARGTRCGSNTAEERPLGLLDLRVERLLKCVCPWLLQDARVRRNFRGRAH